MELTNNSIRSFPDVQFVETNTDLIFNEMMAAFQEEFGRVLYPADPERLRMLWFASILSQERSMINIAAKRNLPRYAEGEYLDSLSELFFGLSRVQATPALTTLLFAGNYTGPEIDYYVIPEGTEVTDESGTIVFATLEDAEIDVSGGGPFTVSVDAECLDPGTKGNGYSANTLTVLVNDIAYVASVTNTVESYNGTDTEDDTSFYDRMITSSEAYAGSGTRTAYEYFAKTVSSSITDVAVTSPSPGIVNVFFAVNGGEVPSEKLLEEVREFLNSDDVRAMTDKVTVSGPVVAEYAINVNYKIDKDEYSDITATQNAIEEAVAVYRKWQCNKIGRDFDLQRLIAHMSMAGADNIQITTVPAIAGTSKSIDFNTIVSISNINLIYGGTHSN